MFVTRSYIYWDRDISIKSGAKRLTLEMFSLSIQCQ